MTSDTPYHVILLAAGKGVRFKSKLPKQFCCINGRAIIFHTVEKFIRESRVENIIVVTPESTELQQKAKDVLEPLMRSGKNITIRAGGSTRQRSVVQGLKCLQKLLEKSGRLWDDEIVTIHDVVRPFVSSDDLSKIISAAKDYKAAGTVKNLIGTVVEMDVEYGLVRSCDRATHKSSESPQAFHLGTIFRSYEKCSEYDLDHTSDCFQIVSTYGGVAVKLIQGDTNNMKITYPTDLVVASKMLEEKSNNIVFSLPSPNSEVESIISKHKILLCHTNNLKEYFSDAASEVLCLLTETFNLQSLAEGVLEILKSSDGSQQFCALKAVIFLLLINNGMMKIDQDFRITLLSISKRFMERNITCHAILVKDIDSSIERLKKALPSLSDDEILPSGQVLYF